MSKTAEFFDLAPELRLLADDGRYERIFVKGDYLARKHSTIQYLFIVSSPRTTFIRSGSKKTITQGRSILLEELLNQKSLEEDIILSEECRIHAIPKSVALDAIDPLVLRYLQLMTSSPSVPILKRFLEQKGVPINDILTFISQLNSGSQSTFRFVLSGSDPVTVATDKGKIEILHFSWGILPEGAKTIDRGIPVYYSSVIAPEIEIALSDPISSLDYRGD